MWNNARKFSSISPSVVLNSLKERDLINRNTNIPADCFHKDRPSVYVGFDPTANSLHTGNLVSIIALLHFQKAGYRPLAVIGGATGIIGDPSGRTKERDVLPEDQLLDNITGISKTLFRIGQNAKQMMNIRDHTNSDPSLFPMEILNNADWYGRMPVIDFMANIGRHFRLSSMLHKESVHQRLNSPEGMSFTEFSYQIFQAYDFLYLSKSQNCWLQIGGSDQWGNITAGCRYVHKCSDQEVHGLTVPLITDSLGQKLGKSAGNAVWLSPDKTSPYHLYQYFINTTDNDVERFLKYFTFISVKDINAICTEHKMNPEHRIAQKHLAENVTRLIHGEEGLTQSQNATAALFGDPIMLTKMSGTEIEQLFKNTAPCSIISKDVLSSSPKIIELAVTAGAVQSKKHARRLVNSGGLYVNNLRVETSDDCMSHDSHVIDDCITLIRIGKKTHHVIKWT